MAKKTKEHAEQTRLNLIASARELFLKQGLTKTTMEQIATHAGYTRGAIHWHFKNKVEIFQAMRDLVSIPMVDRLDDKLFNDSEDDSLQSIENTLHELFKTLDNDLATQQTFMILSRCEYAGEFEFLKRIIDESRDGCAIKMHEAFKSAEKQGLLRDHITTSSCARITQSFIIGTIELWISDDSSTGIRNSVHEIITDFIKMFRR